jgi:hypothetical protein
MSYGSEREVAVFSNPNLESCSGRACGVAAGDPESADNARGFTQARFMLAGYESESLAHELVSVFPLITESCERSDGTAGFRKGPAIDNQSPYNIDVRAESVLNAAGETLSWTYEPGELTLAPGQYSPAICRPLDEASPFGSDYVESWFTYYDPTSDKLIESVHLLWDDDFSGTYAEVRTASSAGGAAEGHTARIVKTGESLTVNFVPSSGFALSSVESSCGGSIQGSAFTVNQLTSDCLIEPVFEASVTPGDTLRVSLEEPVRSDTYSGVGNLRGWAVASAGVDRVEIWIDSAYAFDAPYGGERGDVGDAFPDINDSANSGFSAAWNYSLMSLGEHSVAARAYATNGQYAESSATFFVTRFHKPYLGADDEIDLSGAQCSVSDSQISISDAVMDGQIYDILLDWRTAAQDFQIMEIR